MTYNQPEDLRRKVQDAGQMFTSEELQSFLDEANTELETNVGRNYTEIKHNPKQKIRLRFGNLEKFNEIYKLPDTKIPEEKYDVEKGVIEFNETYYEEEIKNNKIKIFYEPQVFKTLELLYGARNILEITLQQTNDEVVGSQIKQIKNKINMIENRLSDSTSSVTTTTSGRPIRRKGKWR